MEILKLQDDISRFYVPYRILQQYVTKIYCVTTKYLFCSLVPLSNKGSCFAKRYPPLGNSLLPCMRIHSTGDARLLTERRRDYLTQSAFSINRF
ncbi:hypothetical protein L596_006414 [Steinernema carpocapsae]|uniref:Uncharacterized protein n=1 Tax=Steinernema carpocapsae TaxID=34508 RepID=A0A4U8VA49_STECR|nr:hypothetical protein L596_006414 [Steinernema carpocapsae]